MKLTLPLMVAVCFASAIPLSQAETTIIEGQSEVNGLIENPDPVLGRLGIRVVGDAQYGTVLTLPSGDAIGSSEKGVTIRKLTALSDGVVRVDYSNRSYDVLTRFGDGNEFEVRSVTEEQAFKEPEGGAPWQQECTYDAEAKAPRMKGKLVGAGNAYNNFGVRQYVGLMRRGACKLKRLKCQLKSNEAGTDSLFVDDVPVQALPGNWQDLERLVTDARKDFGCDFEKKCSIGRGPSGSPLGLRVGGVFIPSGLPHSKGVPDTANIGNIMERVQGSFGKSVCPLQTCFIKTVPGAATLIYNGETLDLSVEQARGLERFCKKTVGSESLETSPRHSESDSSHASGG